MTTIKNLPIGVDFRLASEVDVLPGQVVSKTVCQNTALSMTIFAFDKGEEISTHAARGDAFVTVLEGKGKFVLFGKEFILEKGQSLIMPAGEPHSVHAVEKFKMLLVVIYPPEVVEENRKNIVKIA